MSTFKINEKVIIKYKHRHSYLRPPEGSIGIITTTGMLSSADPRDKYSTLDIAEGGVYDDDLELYIKPDWEE